MLNELVKYAEKNGISDTPGFKTKKGKWLILLSKDGKLIDVVEDDRIYEMCPHLVQFECGNGTRSHFLLDSLGVIVKYMPKNSNDIIKHEYFKNLLSEASKFEPCLKAYLAFLLDAEGLCYLHKKLTANKAKGVENVTVQIDGKCVLDTNGWREWWNEHRREIRSNKKNNDKNANLMLCLADGELVEPAVTHYKISGLRQVGGGENGDSLISFDKSSFNSYGLTQSLNAVCSEQVAITYRNVLEKLITKAPRPICDSLFLHWYKEAIPDADDPFGFIDYKDSPDTENSIASEKIKKLFDSVREGKRPELTKNKYYILQVSGAGGRIMVRDWLTGDFGKLVENIKAWFDDLSIIDPYGKSTAGNFKLSAAMLRLISFRIKEKDPFERVKKELTALEPLIWRSIIENRPLPDTIAAKALKYISSKLLNSDDSLDENLDRIACALLKAYIIRLHKSKGGNDTMKARINEDYDSPAYQAGRMLAVLAAIQQKALGDVNAGLVQRYYTAASTTPKLVIGRLVQMSQHHLDKLSKDNKGLAIWYEQQLADIMSRIIIDQIPIVLNLEGQTLFALGYYQQKAHLYHGKSIEGSETNN